MAYCVVDKDIHTLCQDIQLLRREGIQQQSLHLPDVPDASIA